MAGTHSTLSPSSAKRWASCTASVPAIAASGIVDKSSADADLGTMAHDYAERVLKGELSEKDVPEDFKHVLIYTDYCKRLENRWGGVTFVEKKVPLFYHPSDSGTVDHLILSEHGVFVTDYKNGIGEPVDAELNPQIGIYGLSAIDDPETQLSFEFTDDTKVEMAIIQPRYQGAEPIKVWKTTVGGLREFLKPYAAAADTIREAVASGDTSRLEFNPGYDECRWCVLKRTCTHRVKAASEPLSIEVEVLEYLEEVGPNEGELAAELPIPPVIALTDKQLLGLFANTKLITGLLADVKKEVMERAAAGIPVPGTKMVSGRLGNRQWTDETSVLGTVTAAGVDISDVVESKVKSPAQVEKVFKEKGIKLPSKLKDLVVRKDGAPTVVPDTDPRPALLDLASLLLDEPSEDDE